MKGYRLTKTRKKYLDSLWQYHLYKFGYIKENKSNTLFFVLCNDVLFKEGNYDKGKRKFHSFLLYSIFMQDV